MTTRTNRALLLGVVFLALAAGTAKAQEQSQVEPPSRPVFVSEPVVPTSTPAVRDLPDYKPDPNAFGLEMKRREDFGFIPIEYVIKPKLDPLYEIDRLTTPAPQLDAFSTLIHNYAGQTSAQSPPDTTGDVGTTYYLQATNQTVSTVQVIDKATGANVKKFTMASLATTSPCNSGFCDPIVMYDRAADRWFISELPSSGGDVCVYVSKTNDPTGAWWAYAFAVESSTTDYPKYGVWPQNGNGGSYLIGVNAGSGSNHDLFALDRAKMLAGQAATFQKFSVANLPNSGFQLVLPSDMQGPTVPPNGEPAIFIRPHDNEAQNGASTPTYDLLDMWTLSVDWTTPANSALTQLTSLHIGDYDMTLCGLGSTWNCMPQPGTTQKIDPIREPLHFPLQYRNFGDHQSLVGTFPEDVDGTDHAALRWFELRKTGAGAWSLFQEGLIGGEANVHRSVGSIAMDGSGNIAIGYTRTGTTAPYYPSIYYRGRLASDPLGTMPQGEYSIVDGTFSKTGNERWGDYAGMSIDPSDDCTFWFTTEYMTSSSAVATKVAAFKFDACGCLAVPPAPTASASVPQDNRIDVGWDDSSNASIVQYQIFRATVSGGPYTQIATVADSSPGVASGPGYTYHDDTVSGGTRYYYVVKSTDGVSCVSGGSTEVNALATGVCLLAPTFAGVTSVTNPGSSTCTLTLGWAAGSSSCATGVTYDVYRGTATGFTPSPANRIASGVSGTSYADAVGIATGTTYYYVVRALDTGNSVEETNTIEKNGVPTGPATTSSWTDTFEGALSGGGFDQAGWTKTTITGSTAFVWSTARSHDGTHSWYAQDVSSSSNKVMTSPSFGVIASTTLSFWHTFAFEYSSSTCWDGATLEYTTNGGTTWTVVPAADFTVGAYNGTTASSNPMGAVAAWCQGTIGTLTQVSVNLGADANLVNKTVQIRWHEADDTSVAGTGWYVDTVALSNAGVAGTCSTGSACTAPGAPVLNGTTSDCPGVNLSWTAGTGSTGSYNVYRGTTPGGPYTKLAGMPVLGTSYTDTTATAGTLYYYAITGACDAVGVNESAFSNETSGSKPVNGTACNDGNACTQTDTCQSGACAGSNPVVCTAGDQCHNAGTCDAGTGVCSNPAKADGSACNDGNGCTAGDTCQSGTCTSGSPVVCTPLDQCHDAGVCDVPTGTCSNPAKTDGTACNDGNACTQSDTCQSGACVGANPVVCAASDQCHDAGVCNAATGACSNPAKANGTTCNDANACTQSDTCQSGACVGANPVVCVASDQCHSPGTCDTATGTCSPGTAKDDGSACDDANACTQSDSCQSGACVGTNPVVCAASDPCHDAGVCDSATGACSNPAKADGSACDNANACTQSDSCQSGACVGVNPVVCAASDQCHDAGVCDTATGACSNPVKTDGSACDDGNACTQSDTCEAGACVGAAPVVCAASDQCHDAGVCDTANGLCSNPVKTDGSACNDGNACSLTDTCQSGTCVGANPVVCAASDQCHDAGVCNTATGACSNPAKEDGSACNDGNACTQSDSCQSGACTGANPVGCAASDQCHAAGTCDTATGLCSNPAKADGSACNDGDACTQTDSCEAGTCIGATPVVCAASDQCHLAGTCDPLSGACSNPAKPNGANCDNGNACTQSDSCQAGSCVGANPVVCSASDQCHLAGTCVPELGFCLNPEKPDGSACSDGNACTQGDTCQSGACLGGSAVPGPGSTGGLAFSNPATLDWTAVDGASGYDLIRGSLSALAGGGFAAATEACAGRHVTATSMSDAHVPAADAADWYLIRAYNACGSGTYDDGGPSQSAPRDAGIASSPNACP